MTLRRRCRRKIQKHVFTFRRCSISSAVPEGAAGVAVPGRDQNAPIRMSQSSTICLLMSPCGYLQLQGARGRFASVSCANSCLLAKKHPNTQTWFASREANTQSMSRGLTTKFNVVEDAHEKSSHRHWCAVEAH